MNARTENKHVFTGIGFIILTIAIVFAVFGNSYTISSAQSLSKTPTPRVSTLAPTLAVLEQEKVLRQSITGSYTLDPQATFLAIDFALENALFRGLLRYDQNASPAPSIARRVPTEANRGITNDGKTYTYELNRNWMWSDNSREITAFDFVYSFQRLVDPATNSPYGRFFNDIIENATEISNSELNPTTLGVEALDDYTFVVHLVRPIPYFNSMVCIPITFAVQQENVERDLSDPDGVWYDPTYGEVVGSGPFRLVEWDTEASVIFERNPYFGGIPAQLDRVENLIIDDYELAFEMYEDGDLDIAFYPPDRYETIRSDPILSQEFNHHTVACTNYLVLNNAVFPFNIREVRQAFTLALNRTERSRIFDRSLNSTQLSLLPQGIPGYDEGLGYDFDPEAAKEALDRAISMYPTSFPGGNFPTVNFYYYVDADSAVADFYEEQFETVLGVDVETIQLDRQEFITRRSNQGDFDGMFQWGWCADYLHPSNWLYLLWGSNQENNYAHYSNSIFDVLSQSADAEANPEISMV